MTVAEALAEHIERTKLCDIPTPVVNRVSQLVFDYLGVAYRGSSTETGTIVRTVVARSAASGKSRVIGTGESVDAEAAAFINAVSSHSIEMDDCDDDGFYHISPVVVSAALAVADEVGANGESLLTAVALGCEVMERLSRALNPALRDRGFHTTPVCGIFGAVAAAGKLYGLTAPQLVSALGLAGAFASGLMEFYGPSMQKRINPGPAAQGAIRACRLAQAGFTGAETIFEGERGVFRAFAGQFDETLVLTGLGTDFPVSIGFKLYACARPIHTAVHATLRLREQFGDGALAVERIVLRRHPRWAHYHLASDIRSYHEAQMSVKWSTALALVVGSAVIDDYLQHEHNPQVHALARKVEVQADPTLPTTLATAVELHGFGGQPLAAIELHPLGSSGQPAAREQLVSKFCKLTAVPWEKASNLLRDIENLAVVPKATAAVYAAF